MATNNIFSGSGSLGVVYRAGYACDEIGASRFKPRNKPYIVLHLHASETQQRLDGEIILKFINKFMGDTHAILFTGKKRNKYLDDIAKSVTHADFHDVIGQVKLEVLAALVANADAVLTANNKIFNLAYKLNTPVLSLTGGANPSYMTWSKGINFEIDAPSPYGICQALTCLLSFSMEMQPNEEAFLRTR